MRQAGQIFAAAISIVMCALPVAAQHLSDFAAPRPIPPGSVLVVGFLGGFDRWNDPHRGVRRVALNLRSRGLYAETAGNHRYRTALKFIRLALDTNRNGRIDPREALAARVILFGQSWGGAATVKVARALQSLGVPVLLTIQVDSVGLHDADIPANVREAANFYQDDLWTIKGRRVIRAVDPARTRILGNFQFSYHDRYVDESDSSWMRRTIGRSHVKMELDPLVWNKVEQLILNAAEK